MSAAGYRWAREAGGCCAGGAAVAGDAAGGRTRRQQAQRRRRRAAGIGNGYGDDAGRVAAMVNGDLILESDLDARNALRRFSPSARRCRHPRGLLNG